MLRLERVDICLIWPDPNNPRENFEGLADLAAQFAYTPDRPGEPMTPPLVVPDGTDSEGRQKYRIADGERRYRAMLKAKTESCLAFIADTLEEAMAVAAMLATDDKQPLTSQERARGVQQMLQLGLEDEAVDALAKMKRGSACKVRRVLDQAEKPVQGSLDDLFRIADIEDEYSRGELISLIDAGEDTEFCRRYYAYESEQRNRHASIEYRKWCDDAGIEVSSERPYGMASVGRITTTPVPDNLADSAKSEGVVFATIEIPKSNRAYYERTALTLWKPIAPHEPLQDGEVDAEDKKQELIDARIDDFISQLREHTENHSEFMFGFVECMTPLREYKSGEKMRGLLWRALEDMSGVSATCEDAGRTLVREYPAFMIPMLWELVDTTCSMFELAAAVVHDDPSFTDAETYRGYIDVLDALECLGYMPDEFERQTCEKIRGFMKEGAGE